MKRFDRLEAITLRRNGATYQAIRDELGIAKSTLWQWLKAEGLVETQPQKLTELKRLAQRKAAATVKAQRLARTQVIIEQASQQVGPLSKRELWLLGVALYWAEGAKQKPHDASRGVIFSNSDPKATQLFIHWLQTICGISPDRLVFDVFIHETANAQATRAFWAAQLGLSGVIPIQVYWKRHRPQTNRHNTGDSYHGVMRVRVRRSSELNRRIQGWVAGICDSLGSSVMVTHWALDPANPGSTPGSPALGDAPELDGGNGAS